MMYHAPVVPALIPESEAAVHAAARAWTFSHEFHLDLVDGKFVPAVSWPYDPSGTPRAVAMALAPYTLEVDLMVADPLTAAAEWVAAGADRLVFHVETLTVEEFAQFAQTCSASVGVSRHGVTSLATLESYLAHADYVQLMGIAEIGAQGQPFHEPVLEDVATLKQHHPRLSITVDGSVNAETITRLFEAGTDRFVAGSAIVQQPDPAAAHAALRALVHE